MSLEITYDKINFTNSTFLSSSTYQNDQIIPNSLVGDKIAFTNSNLLVNELDVTNYQPGDIIEQFSTPCDGSTITVDSGSYTVSNVTAVQNLTDSFAVINGSEINYVPPPQATRVLYQFTFANFWSSHSGNSWHAITHFLFQIDNQEITHARFNHSGGYPEQKYTFEWPVLIGGSTNDFSVGRLSSWTGLRNLRLLSRHYSGNNRCDLHGARYWAGANNVQFSRPLLSIKAIA